MDDIGSVVVDVPACSALGSVVVDVPACSASSSVVAGEGACTFDASDEPEGWDTAEFDASDWPQADVYSASEVGPKDGYDQISWADDAELIWGPDLEQSNTVLCRLTVE